LLGGGQYLDFNNSDIRLVVENIKRANQDGALIASRVKAVDYTFDDNGKVNGVVAEDLLNGKKFEINARYVINTTGPWSDKTRNLNKPEHPIEMMRPTKGVHLVIDRSKLEVSQPIYFDSGYNDGRMIFVIPREKKTYFGTTDTDYHGDFEHPTVTQADVDYLLKAVNNRFPKANITLDDIESSWAGLRPLIAGNAASDYNGGDNGKISDDSFNGLIDTVQSYLKKDKTRDDVEKAITNLQGSLSEKELSPSEVSRGSSLEQDDNGLITLAGGKITDYRKMAAGAMELIIKLLAENYDRHYQLINSKTYPVSGGEINPNDIESAFDAYAQMGVTRGLEREDAYYLASFFGSNAPQVYAYVDKVPAVEGMSLAETVMLFYSLDNECVLTPNDYFLRRTNYMLFMRDKMDRLIDPVLNIMQEYFGWSDEEKQNHMDHLQKALYDNDLIALKEHKKA
ncbi:MAG: glycerol-3-phosphate dehydrogenase/oxidase, partial [Lactobacillus iners]|nr:glycerol-3-phosphate dehydrogenase/oxidase [Lactobacillus iners]